MRRVRQVAFGTIRRPRFLGITLVLVPVLAVATLGGCVSGSPQRAFEGASRPMGELSMLVATRRAGAGDLEEIILEEIDGAAEQGDWSSPERRVLLVPGEHEFVVRRMMTAGQPGLASLVVNSMEKDRSTERRRRLRLLMNAGFAYRIHQTGEPPRFFINRVPIGAGRKSAPVTPPWDARECTPVDDEASEIPVLDCGNGK